LILVDKKQLIISFLDLASKYYPKLEVIDFKFYWKIIPAIESILQKGHKKSVLYSILLSSDFGCFFSLFLSDFSCLRKDVYISLDIKKKR